MESKRKIQRKKKKALLKRRIKQAPLSYYVIGCIILLLIYTTVVIILNCLGIIVQDELTIAFFAAFGGEVFNCARIKIFKLKGENENGQIDE